jgi:hypothetical protein
MRGGRTGELARAERLDLVAVGLPFSRRGIFIDK